MSHYTVLVQTKTDPREDKNAITRALSPFNEDLKIAFEDKTKEVISKWNEENNDDIKSYEELLEEGNEEKLRNFKQFLSDYFGYHIIGKRIGYYYNPQAKWDWYEIGGRWDGYMKSKSKKAVNTCKVKDLDFTLDIKSYDRAIRFWNIYMEKHTSELTEEEIEEIRFITYKRQYYIDRYGSKERYAEEQSMFSTFSILTAKNEWLEAGEMGWFGLSYTTHEKERAWHDKYKQIIESMDQESYVTIVDYHI